MINEQIAASRYSELVVNLEKLITGLTERSKQLDRHIKEYAQTGNFGDAAINQIKKGTFDICIRSIQDVLNKSYNEQKH